MLRLVSLGASLLILWLLLSGHYDALLIGLGVASTLLVVYVTSRMEAVDEEGHPIHVITSAVTYMPWLMWAIVKSNIDVAKIILSKDMKLSTNLIEIKATQHSDLGRVIYANSITLTPGTVTLSVNGEMMTIHGLTREASDDVLTGDMDRRVSALEV
ncbi:MAG: Na+/H+ antiporter subunit E [Magnetospiraceae bacterium]